MRESILSQHPVLAELFPIRNAQPSVEVYICGVKRDKPVTPWGTEGDGHGMGDQDRAGQDEGVFKVRTFPNGEECCCSQRLHHSHTIPILPTMEAKRRHFSSEVNTTEALSSASLHRDAHTTTTAICPLCQKVSWTGEADRKGEVEDVMNKFIVRDWCNCKHVLDDEYVEYPPKAGTGEKVDESQ